MRWLRRLLARRDTTRLRIEAERQHMHHKARELVAQSQHCLTHTKLRRAAEVHRRAAE